MKFLDIIKIAIHNMWNNKARTLLVTLVIFILATLITFILAFTIGMLDVSSVSFSSYDSTKDAILEKPYRGGSNEPVLTDGEVKNYYDNIFLNHQEYFSYVTYKGGRNCYIFDFDTTFIHMDQNCLINQSEPVISGRLWNKEDENKNYVWVTESYVSRNPYLKLGDSIEVYIPIDEYHANIVDFEVKGIVKSPESNYHGNSTSMYIDFNFAKEYNIPIRSMTFGTIDGTISSDFFSIIGYNKVLSEFNDYDYMTGKGSLMFSSPFVEDALINIYISVGAIAGAIVLSIIIILLCIGCISNSIEITVEENKQFFGMMKAIGLKNDNIKKIVRWQSIFMIIIATFFAALLDTLIMYLVKPSIAQLFGLSASIITFEMPAYVPFIVLLLLISLVVLCTIKSLNKISKMDVVSVISEVD